ncbi:GTP pyrophosphokinase [Pseudomonas corrugata]
MAGDSTKSQRARSANWVSRDFVQSLAGVRIITHFASDLDRVATLVEREFDIDLSNSVDKRMMQDPDRFGYASIHYVVEFGASRLALPEYSRYSRFKVEIQIRSILQHAWAEIEHDIGYKADVEIPNTIRRKFSRLSGLLELADQEFVAISSELVNYAKSIREAPVDKLDEVFVDKTSLENFVTSNEYIVSLDLQLAEIMSTVICEPHFSFKEIDALKYLGMESLGDIFRGVRSNRELILKRAKDIAGSDSSSNSGLLCSGASVAYLMQIIAAKSKDENFIRGYVEFLDVNHPDHFVNYLLSFY